MSYAADALLSLANTGLQAGISAVTNARNQRRSKELMALQNEYSRQNWQNENARQDYLNANQYVIKSQAAKSAGINPLSILSVGNNMQVGSIPTPQATPAHGEAPKVNIVGDLQALAAKRQSDSQSSLNESQRDLIDEQAEALRLQNENTKSTNDTIDFVFSLNPDYEAYKNSGIKFNQGFLTGLDGVIENAAHKAEGLSRESVASYTKALHDVLSKEGNPQKIADGMLEQARGFFISNNKMEQEIQESQQRMKESVKRVSLMDSQIRVNGATYHKIQADTQKVWVDIDAVKNAMRLANYDSYGDLIEKSYQAWQEGRLEEAGKLLLTLSLKHPTPQSITGIIHGLTGGDTALATTIGRYFKVLEHEAKFPSKVQDPSPMYNRGGKGKHWNPWTGSSPSRIDSTGKSTRYYSFPDTIEVY